MLLKTYNKIMQMFDNSTGYLTTQELQAEKITMVQLKDLISMNIIERVTHGVYWRIDTQNGKPENYKFIELAKANPKCIICAESALFYHGYIEKEPAAVSVATGRTDRARMHVNFPMKRHYFSDQTLNDDIETVETPYGSFRVYGIDRSVCDCIRLREDIEPEIFNEAIRRYKNDPKKNLKRFTEYAYQMRFKNIALSYVTND